MNKHVHIATRCIFGVTTFCIMLWLLIVSEIIPWPDASNGEPLVTKIFSIITLVSFALCPISVIIKDVANKHFHISMIIGIITLLTYIPFFIQRRTFKSEICTCCDRYLIPENIMDIFLVAAMICSFLSFLIVGIYSFKKRDS